MCEGRLGGFRGHRVEATELHLDRGTGWGWMGIQEWGQCPSHLEPPVLCEQGRPPPKPNPRLCLSVCLSPGAALPPPPPPSPSHLASSSLFFPPGLRHPEPRDVFPQPVLDPPKGEGGRIVLARELRSQRLNHVPSTVPKGREGRPRKANQTRAGEGRVDSCWWWEG